MINVKIGETKYPATVDGNEKNPRWDSRESKAITVEMTYAVATTLFVDGLAWSIVMDYEQPIISEETGEPTGETKTVFEEYDNSAFSVLGDIVVHADGTLTVNMGKPTDLEETLELLYGGEA